MTDDELSAAVAQALGLQSGHPDAPKGGFALDLRAGTCRDIPATVPYAGDWNATARVIEAMQKRGWRWSLRSVGPRWHAVANNGAGSLCDGNRTGHGVGDSLPRAVCMAALRALDANHD